MEQKILFSVRETAQVLGLGRTKIYELINGGRLHVVRIGRRTLIKASSVREIAELD